MAEDNWKHRSEGMRYKTCMFFVPKVSMQPQPATAMEAVMTAEPGAIIQGPSLGPGKIIISPKTICPIGRCRRHAPTMSGWPVVFVNDWCGDHKIDEEKVEPCP